MARVASARVISADCSRSRIVAGMVTDMNLSSDMGTAFAEHLRENDIQLTTDVSVQVVAARLRRRAGDACPRGVRDGDGVTIGGATHP